MESGSFPSSCDVGWSLRRTRPTPNQGYNKFEKSLSKDLKKGKDWQKRVSALFRNNKLFQKALNDFENTRKTLGLIKTEKKHTTNK